MPTQSGVTDQAAELSELAGPREPQTDPAAILLRIINSALTISEPSTTSSDIIVRCRRCSAGWILPKDGSDADASAIFEHVARHGLHNSLHRELVGRGRL